MVITFYRKWKTGNGIKVYVIYPITVDGSVQPHKGVVQFVSKPCLSIKN